MKAITIWRSKLLALSPPELSDFTSPTGTSPPALVIEVAVKTFIKRSRTGGRITLSQAVSFGFF